MKKIKNIYFIILSLYVILSPYITCYENIILSFNLIFIIFSSILIIFDCFKNKNIREYFSYILLFIIPILYLVPIIFNELAGNLFTNLKYFISIFSFSLISVSFIRFFDKKYINIFLKNLIISIFISDIISILSVTDNFFLNDILGRSVFSDYYANSINRFYGYFGYPNTNALLNLVAILLLFYFIFENKCNKKIMIFNYFQVFICMFCFLLSFSKIVFLILILIYILIILKNVITHNKKEIKSIFIYTISLIIPMMFLVGRFRIYLINRNFLFLSFFIFVSFIIFIVNIYLLEKYYKIKNFIIEFIIILILLLYPNDKKIIINNVLGTNSAIITDFSNLEIGREYSLKMNIKNKSKLSNAYIYLSKLSEKDGLIIYDNVSVSKINLGENNFTFNFITESQDGFYYIFIDNIDRFTNLEIDSVKIYLNDYLIKTINLDYYLMPYQYLHLKEQRKYDISSVNDRFKYYKNSIERSKKHGMFIGHGVDAYYFYGNNTDNTKDPHSHIFKLLLETGIFGVLYFLILILVIVILTIRNLKNKFNYISLSLLIIIASSIFDLNMSNLFIYFIFYILLSIIIKLNNIDNKKVMFISSVGGHLTEILSLEKLFKKYDYIIITEKNKISKELKNKYKVNYLMYGSRYYPFKYIFTCLVNVFMNFLYFIVYNPKIIYTTGAHTSVIMCYLGYFFNKKIIYVEVFDRIETLTLTAKLVYPIADKFIVQHDNYKFNYPKSIYIKGVY